MQSKLGVLYEVTHLDGAAPRPEVGSRRIGVHGAVQGDQIHLVACCSARLHQEDWSICN